MLCRTAYYLRLNTCRTFIANATASSQTPTAYAPPSKLLVKELKARLAVANLPTTGRKADLVKRLEQHIVDTKSHVQEPDAACAPQKSVMGEQGGEEAGSDEELKGDVIEEDAEKESVDRGAGKDGFHVPERLLHVKPGIAHLGREKNAKVGGWGRGG